MTYGRGLKCNQHVVLNSNSGGNVSLFGLYKTYYIYNSWDGGTVGLSTIVASGNISFGNLYTVDKLHMYSKPRQSAIVASSISSRFLQIVKGSR